MKRLVSVSLPVRDLNVSRRFYEAIGFRRNARLSSAAVCSMTLSDRIAFQLTCRDAFARLTGRAVPDVRETAGLLVALPLESREAVDAIVEAAWSFGGRVNVPEATDLGFMYLRSFEDPDGHMFEAVWMVAEGARCVCEAE